MYAIVKTGGKQYKVAPGDVVSVEKLNADLGDEVELPVICVVDGTQVEANADKAAKTTVTAEILEQYRDKKKLVFKFKKRKGYKRLKGHRQSLTRVRIMSVGSERYEPKPSSKKEDTVKDMSASQDKEEGVSKDVSADKVVEEIASLSALEKSAEKEKKSAQTDQAAETKSDQDELSTEKTADASEKEKAASDASAEKTADASEKASDEAPEKKESASQDAE